MPRKRSSMRKIREVLRLHHMGLSSRQIARSVGLAQSTVTGYLHRAQAANLSWPLPEDLEEAAVERLLFVPREEPHSGQPLPDWRQVHAELRRKHVTLALLWEEYKRDHPDGYKYSRFCDLYRRWAKGLEVWMRQEHRGGEKVFVDFSGDGIAWWDSTTRERREARLFVAALGASSYTYAEATEDEKLLQWLNAQAHALEFFQGVPAVIVPDQPRSLVRKPCRYDPELNPQYAEFADHYGTSIVPARPRKPRDKAKVEAGVLVAQRWIIAALRNRRFHSIDEINEAIGECLEKLNHRKMRKFGRSRHEFYLEVDKPNLQPLPSTPFEFADWKLGVRVNLDYHIVFDDSYYSVPFSLAHKPVDVRATARTVEIFFKHERVASHTRSYHKFHYSTCPEHMPKSHQKHAEWTPARIIRWAEKVGPSTAQLVTTILSERPHPEQGYRACLGILRLGKQYSEERLERACKRALAFHSHSYRAVESILKRRLEDHPLPEVPQEPLPPHRNVRGSTYYS